MNIIITIKRQKSENEKPYLQSFLYNGDGNITIAEWLTECNSQTNLKDISGKTVEPIVWECGCMEKKCGACAMLINNKPMLACNIFIKNAVIKEKIMLAPLSKFPVIKDLVVDRKAMFEMLKNTKVWLSEKKWSDFNWDRENQYKAGQCIMCGCCLEVCPNFLAKGTFGGAAAIVQSYKALEQNSTDEHYNEMKKSYIKQVYNECGQSLSCQKVCPMKLPIDELQVRTNALIKKH